MTTTVTFPGLGLELELNRVAFSLFGKEIYWYGIIIACGFLLAVAYCYRQAPKFAVNPGKLMDMLYFAVPACVIGARAYYVIFYPSLYKNADGSFSWSKAIAIWDGGLAIYGMVIVAIITVAVYCKVRKQSFLRYCDVGSYGVLIGQLVGRWGNFVNVECYGGVTAAPWRMCSPKIAAELLEKGLVDSSGYEQVLSGVLGVHPTFLYESLWNLLGFVLMVIMAKKFRKFDGQSFVGYLIWYGAGRAVIEGMRTDSLYFFGTGLRSSQLVGVVSLVAGIILAVIFAKTQSPATQPVREQATGDEKQDRQDKEEK